MEIKQRIVNALGIRLKSIFEKLEAKEFDLIYEIRIRINKPVIIIKKGEEVFLTSTGTYTKDLRQGMIATK